jgi:hypothetical protein
MKTIRFKHNGKFIHIPVKEIILNDNGNVKHSNLFKNLDPSLSEELPFFTRQVVTVQKTNGKICNGSRWSVVNFKDIKKISKIKI